ncbi:hypothetical protein TUMEXPCC7403_24485 [Tumidithrix helvetica PCC 7403]|uniref:hypothetical protein n=1 Tax=Tumidithrix helvetica TaxID=3457545 RepID=UPI003C85C20F
MSVESTIQAFAQLQIDRSQLFLAEDKVELEKLFASLPNDYNAIADALSNWCRSRSAIYDALLDRLEALVEPFIATGRQPHHSYLHSLLAQLTEPPGEDATLQLKMKYKLQSEKGKAFYRLRKSTVEPVFVSSKHLWDFVSSLGFLAAQEFTNYCLDSAKFVNPTLEDYLQSKEKASMYPDQTITLVDATIAILSEKMNLPVWTYDYHFDVMGTPVWR